MSERREAVRPSAFDEPRVQVRRGPIVVFWWDRRSFWFRVFGYGLSVKPREAWRVFSCRNRKGLHRYHVIVGPVLVCPLRRVGV